MRRRCDDPTANKYENYGGRGITYCSRWESVENFVADMGRRPSENHTLDRINSDGNYEPSNCKWSTVTEQNNNRRANVFYEYQGKTYLLTELSEMYNVKYTTIQERLKRGWSLEKALTHPVQKRTGGG
jgi:hypothetical protein